MSFQIVDNEKYKYSISLHGASLNSYSDKLSSFIASSLILYILKHNNFDDKYKNFAQKAAQHKSIQIPTIILIHTHNNYQYHYH